VRELRLLQRVIDARRDVLHRDDANFIESAGFLLTAQTQASLKEINLTRPAARTRCERVLILDNARKCRSILALVPALARARRCRRSRRRARLTPR